MRLLLAVLLMLHNGAFSNGICFNQPILCESTLNLTNKTQNCQVLNDTEFAQCSNVTELILSHNNIAEIAKSSQIQFSNLVRLDFSFNCLKHLPQDFLSRAVHLQTLNLSNNNLKDLPDGFLENSNKLELLSLERNPLSSIPSSIFKASLKNLSVDCRCDIVGHIVNIILQQCAANNISSSNCMNPFFRCVTSSLQWSTLRDFYEKQCSRTSLLALYICLPIVVVGILGGIAAYCFMKRRKVGTDFPTKEASSDLSPSHGQPRYTTRNMGGLSQAGPQQVQAPSKEYENVFVGPLQSEPIGQYECLDRKKQQQGPKSRKQPPDEDYYMNPDANGGDQPIYCNAQSAFYSNASSSNMDDDDVYIVPDK
uniref:Leucine-rich repeat-containing protein 25 n=1 Tax=Geotrypetes seraphini TaxID=260995 RepID=A0A6P8S4Q6_GEOSA|nr:leucine-rich repeat-containing protein 25 [Geotrypetes seraphini]XP_033812143.1 leucine-rich repeat-containing protein 25 [Geotrypetes seraphini]